MENKKKSLLAGTLVAGALITAASFSANAASMFRYNELGSGASVRSNLLESNVSANRALELKCGADSTKAKDGKCGAKKGKSKDGKCGEGKCGDKKKAKAAKKDAPAN